MSIKKELKELIPSESLHWTQLRDNSIRDKKLTKNHLKYIQSIEKNIVTICTGFAGTGKTHIASRIAAEMLISGKVKRIIITRPIVECDEELGILPGNMEEKMQPYLAPLAEALKKYLGHKEFENYVKSGTVEICPLAVMRGKTFDESFIILDEAQNATFTQLRMIMTRIGANSKLVITGDTEQIDLRLRESPLIEATDRIMGTPKHPNIDHIEFQREDCLRPKIVQFLDERMSRDYGISQTEDMGPVPTYGQQIYNNDW